MEVMGQREILEGQTSRNMFSWSSPTLQWQILLADCWGETDPSCFSATCMKLKRKASICNLLSEIPNGAGFLLGSSGEEKMLALSGGDVGHCGATPCFATSLARAVCKPMSLSSSSNTPSFYIGREQAQIPPLEALRSRRERNHCENQGDVLAAWQQQPVHNSRSTSSQTKSELNIAFSSRWLALILEGGRHPSFAGFISSISSEMQTHIV